jgi:hypothetical protein
MSNYQITKADRKEALTMIERLTILMNGGEMDGVKMGDAGITFEWVKSTRDHYARIAMA